MRTAHLLGAVLAPGLALGQTLCPLLPLETPLGEFQGDLSVDGTRLAATVQAAPASTVALMERDGPAWRPIPANLPLTNGELFGYALDLEGPSLLAAAPFASGPRGDGVIRTFVETPAGWLAGPDVTTNHPRAQYFAQVLDRDGGWLAVRSWWTNLLTIESRVHLFRINPPTVFPTFDELLVIDDPLPLPANGFSNFGRALAVSGQWLVIGSARAPEGRAYLWRIGASSVTFVQELDVPLPRSNEYGMTVDVDGDRIVVGDPAVTGPAGQARAGAVHVFERVPGATTFTYAASVHGPSSPASSSFGASIDLAGSRLAATFVVPSIVALPPGEGLAVFDDVGLPTQSVRVVVQSPLGPVEPVGQLARLGADEVLTTNRTVYTGTSGAPAGDLGRWALHGVGLLVCSGAPNSSGSGGVLELLGCGGASPLFGSASSLPASTFAVPVIGTGEAMMPVGQGTLCIAAPTRLGVVATAVQGTAIYALSPALTAFAPGAVVRTQLWFRDGSSSNLTDALEFEVVH
jgi:hypothetical protein